MMISFVLLALLLSFTFAFAFSSALASEQSWFSIDSHCFKHYDIRVAADIRGFLEDGTAIGVFKNGETYKKVLQSLCTENNKIGFEVLGEYIPNLPAMILPSTALFSLNAKSIVFLTNDWILIQDDIDTVMAGLPSNVEPQLLNDKRMKPQPRSLPFKTSTSSTTSSTGASVKNDKIVQLVQSVSTEAIVEFLEDLTNGFHTRLSTSNDVDDATDFLLQSYQARNVSVTEFSYTFPAGYPPNVIAVIPGVYDPDRYVIIGAHYDDRAQNINDVNARAPGANDDGSGTAALLEAARVFGASGMRFNYSIMFASFSGEEQGLYGSNAYADYLYSIGTDIVAMIQADMIAHRFPQNPNKMELTTRYASEALNVEVEDISNQYVPSLEVGRTTACCSDQQPFYENGYYSTALVEAGGYTIDPQYHTTTDVMYRDDYSFEQLTLITQVLVATCASFAEPL